MLVLITVMGVEGRIESSLGRAAIVASTPFDSFRETREPHLFYNASKRLIDLVLAFILLILTAPLVLVAMSAIFLTTGKTPLLAQRRVGLHGRPFRMFKLRTMRDMPSSDFALSPKSPADPRITKVGVVLRRTSIDELPQLVNVLLGQMSLAGPRPVLAFEAALYRSGWRRRFSVKPGLTGLWQVSGRSSLSVKRWMALDRCYLRKRSLPFDVSILLRTVRAVITMRGAW